VASESRTSSGATKVQLAKADPDCLTDTNMANFKGCTLEKKLELYSEWANKMIDTGKLDYQVMNNVLRELMDQNNMSALWSTLKTALNNTGSKQVQEAWGKICERGVREGKTETKAEVL